MFERDTIQTAAGPLQISFIGHGTLMFEFNDLVIHVDPVSREADYARLPKADLILVTHEHGDHLDVKALAAVRTPATRVVVPPVCAEAVPAAVIMKNGAVRTVAGLRIEAVPAYNLRHKRPSGEPFHPRGRGNGTRGLRQVH